MNKINKILSTVILTCLCITAMSALVYAVTGESVIVIIQKYFVDDVEVSEEEYNNTKNTKYIIVENRKYTTEETIVAKEIVITPDRLTQYNVGSISDYIRFDTDAYSNVIKAVVNEKVVAVKYDYEDTDYSTFFNSGENGYYFDCENDGVSYMDVNSETENHYKNTGVPATSRYFVCGEDYTNVVEVEDGYTLFYFENDDDKTPMNFSHFFKSVTIYVTE